jgi:hypothetical protein
MMLTHGALVRHHPSLLDMLNGPVPIEGMLDMRWTATAMLAMTGLSIRAVSPRGSFF